MQAEEVSTHASSVPLLQSPKHKTFLNLSCASSLGMAQVTEDLWITNIEQQRLQHPEFYYWFQWTDSVKLDLIRENTLIDCI